MGRPKAKFVPPVEVRHMDGNLLGSIRFGIDYLRRTLNMEGMQEEIRLIEREADELSLNEARKIQAEDALLRLRTDALAISNQIGILKMLLDHAEDDLNKINHAREVEHEQWQKHVEQLRHEWNLQRLRTTYAEKKEESINE